MKKNNVRFDYDSESDVLYLFIDKPQPAYGESIGGASGIVVRRSFATGEVVGLTIIGFKQAMKQKLIEKYKKELPPAFSKTLLGSIYKQLEDFKTSEQ